MTPTALSDLIKNTREQHREDNYDIDQKLKAFSKIKPCFVQRAGLVKGVFKANSCPLNANLEQPRPRKEKRISAGILKGVYEALPRDELRLLTDLCAFVPERYRAVCVKTPISAWEDYNDKYTIIRFDPAKTKVHYDHIGILPRTLADRIREYAKQTRRYPDAPFPNAETLWREVTRLALDNFGVRLTSKYLRKEYTAKAKKTQMPTNDWDFLAGHKQRIGNQAHHYDPEDDDNLVREYDKYLAPYLGLWNTKDPDEAGEPFKADAELRAIRRENSELRTRLDQLMQLLQLKLQTNPQ